MTKFIDYKQLINQKTGKYPFLRENTEGSKEDGEHWWGISVIGPKKDLFFFSFGAEGLKNFITTDDKKTVQKILIVIGKIARTDIKITLVNIKFSVNACKYLSSKEIEKLSNTSRD